MASRKAITGLHKISSDLASECGTLCFSPPVAAVYNPLEYAKSPHRKYLELAGSVPKKVIFLGMNPGPWGMAQTGVPFGEIAAVRDWLGIEAEVGKPLHEHPKRPISGFACKRSEVSGRRLWGLFRERFGNPEKFFRDHFVANYCPLVFMDSGGANMTPDKLPASESSALFEICDRALADTIRLLQPEWVIGVGAFAKKKIDLVHKHLLCSAEPGSKNTSGKTLFEFNTAQILHPSPANPKAHSGWEREVTKTLEEIGVW